MSELNKIQLETEFWEYCIIFLYPVEYIDEDKDKEYCRVCHTKLSFKSFKRIKEILLLCPELKRLKNIQLENDKISFCKGCLKLYLFEKDFDKLYQNKIIPLILPAF